MKQSKRTVTSHVIEHSNAESETHAKDKARFDVILAARQRDEALQEDVVKIAEAILLRLGSEKSYAFQASPNRYLIRAGNGSLNTTAGNEYEVFLKSASARRKHYRRSPRHKLQEIGAHSGLDVRTFTFLPAHSAHIRTLPAAQQEKVILELAQNRAAQIEALTGWEVQGIAVHNDTAIVPFDLVLTRYSEPVPPLPGTRQRQAACRLLGDRKGIRATGPCVTGFFRYAMDKHRECARPGLRKAALRKIRAHRRRYHGERPVDMQVALGLDHEVREQFGGVPEFQQICQTWYALRARLLREEAIQKLKLSMGDGAREKQTPGQVFLNSLLDGFVEDGMAGFERELGRHQTGLVQPLEQRMAGLLRERDLAVAQLQKSDGDLTRMRSVGADQQLQIEILKMEHVLAKAEVMEAEDAAKTTEKERDQLQAQVAGAQDELARCREVIGCNKECIIELRNEAALARKKEEEVGRRDAELYRPFVEEAQAAPELRNMLASAKDRIATLEAFVDKRETEIREQAAVAAELQRRLDQSDQENMALQERGPGQPPKGKEYFHLFDIRANEVVGSGNSDRIKDLWEHHPKRQPLMMVVDTSALLGWKLDSIALDPATRQDFIDRELAQGKPELGLLAARFPKLQGTGQLEQALQCWGAETFHELKRRGQGQRSAAVVHGRPVPLTR